MGGSTFYEDMLDRYHLILVLKKQSNISDVEFIWVECFPYQQKTKGIGMICHKHGMMVLAVKVCAGWIKEYNSSKHLP